MAIRKIKPTTPGKRFMTVSAFEEITCTTPEKSLLEDLRSSGGRNNHGRITVRHHGGGEGKSPIGRPGPVTPWGKPALGYKTRKTKNVNDKFIVRRRNGK